MSSRNLHNDPPNIPSSYTYTSCYCEENIYLLCQTFLANELVASVWDPYVIFISNESRTVALWSQKNAKEEGEAVVWDYHVILALHRRASCTPSDLRLAEKQQERADSWVYDFDCVLPMPQLLDQYIDRTFVGNLPPFYQSLFRVIPGQTFLDEFASDRSHMIILEEGGTLKHTYSATPPAYPPIQGTVARSKSVTNNLMDIFVCMKGQADGHGNVLNLAELKEWALGLQLGSTGCIVTEA